MKLFESDAGRVGLLATANLSTGKLAEWVSGVEPVAQLALTLVQIAVAIATAIYIAAKTGEILKNKKPRKSRGRRRKR